jgi:dTDP-3-amino-3,4,6-trideoxy-alpha-D-glucose transaminase
VIVPFLDLPAQHAALGRELAEVCERLLASCAFAGGPEVEAFEQAFATYCGVGHCVGVGSGTAALELLLEAYGVGRGDDVIVPAFTFFATAEAVSRVGAAPVFVDVRETTASIDPRLLARAITPRTKAIIPVHLYGQPADMSAILSIAAERRLTVIEDSCQAHGASYRGRRAGSLAHAAAFSFYPGKNLGACGEAGAITTDDAAIASAVRMLRDHGSARKYEHELVGHNQRMDGLQAGFLRVKLAHLDEWNGRRRAHAARYSELLRGVPGVALPGAQEGAEAVYHLFAVRVVERDRVRSQLAEAGIGTHIHYPLPLHLQPAYRGLDIPAGSLPVSERFAEETLSLPMFPELSGEQVEYVARTLATVLA